MSVHTLKIVQKIPIPVKEAWDFFSKPLNLQVITPESFQFKILSNLDDRPIYEGQIIEYTVRPLFRIKMHWTTVITKVKQEVMFIDEQKRGPYRSWKHQHFFKPVNGGTEMTDIVEYEIPGWFAGDLVNALLIKNNLQKLFNYRHSKISTLMGRL